MNINSLQFRFDELENFLANCPVDFQVLGITKSRLKEANAPTTSIILPRFTYENMPTKSVNGGALLYIKNAINYKLRPDLNINKDKELESIFKEIVTKNSKNIIVSCIYRHPCMHPQEFNSIFLKPLTNKLSKENNKEIILLGDFNIDLIKTNKNNNASEFLDRIYSSYLIPQITSPTRLTSRSHTLIANIISNVIIEDTISGNIMNIISDHLGQFIILPYHFVESDSKQETFHRNFKNFSKKKLLSDLKKINWESLFSQHKQDVNLFYKLFLDEITHLLDIHAPITKLSIKEK